MELDLDALNAELGNQPEKLVQWAIGLGKPAICTTNFRPFEAVILHMVSQVKPDIPVVWMDSGYNTEATYRFADEVTRKLGLNLITYLPKRSRAHREAIDGPVPGLDDPRHAALPHEGDGALLVLPAGALLALGEAVLPQPAGVAQGIPGPADHRSQRQRNAGRQQAEPHCGITNVHLSLQGTC